MRFDRTVLTLVSAVALAGCGIFPLSRTSRAGTDALELAAKPAPVDSEFEGCGPDGSQPDYALNRRKNRIDEGAYSREAAHKDYHMWLSEHPNDKRARSIVVEITPRVRVKHPLWTETQLASLDSVTPVSPGVAAVPWPASASETEEDEAPTKHFFRKRDALMAGAFVLAAAAVAPADRHFAKLFQDTANFNDPMVRLASTDISLVGRPGFFIVGGSMYAIGRLTHRDMLAHLGLHATEAMAIGEVTNDFLKGSLGRERPRSDINDPFDFRPGHGFKNSAYRSLPSSHYGAAGLVGLTCMYNNEHWASDALMGAGIGTLSGLKVVQYSHDNPSNAVDRALLRVTISPTPQHGAALLASFSVH